MRGMSGESLLVVTADTVDYGDPVALFKEHLDDAVHPYDAAVSYTSVALQGLQDAKSGKEFDAAMSCVLDPSVGGYMHRIDEEQRPDNAPRIIGQHYATSIAHEVLDYADRADNYGEGVESWAARRKVFNRDADVRQFDLRVMSGAMKKVFANEVFMARSKGSVLDSARALVAANAVSAISVEKHFKI